MAVMTFADHLADRDIQRGEQSPPSPSLRPETDGGILPSRDVSFGRQVLLGNP
jgi:hypothetical protein